MGFDSGYQMAQVYAPAAHDVIAFEPMTAPTNSVVSGDGLRHVAPRGVVLRDVQRLNVQT